MKTFKAFVCSVSNVILNENITLFIFNCTNHLLRFFKMFPYIVNYYKKPRKEKAKSLGLATDCLIDKEIESIIRIWKGEYSESVKILDKIIPKITKYKRGGIAGTEYNQSSFILPMITPEEIAKENSERCAIPSLYKFKLH